MITLGQAEVSVPIRLPPAVGEFAGFQWQPLYNAILHVMLYPKSQRAYKQAYAAINGLPQVMKMTPQVLVAAWARFSKLYPGWRRWQYEEAYHRLIAFMHNAGRMLPDDGRQWFAVEREWQRMEAG